MVAAAGAVLAPAAVVVAAAAAAVARLRQHMLQQLSLQTRLSAVRKILGKQAYTRATPPDVHMSAHETSGDGHSAMLSPFDIDRSDCVPSKFYGTGIVNRHLHCDESTPESPLGERHKYEVFEFLRGIVIILPVSFSLR